MGVSPRPPIGGRRKVLLLLAIFGLVLRIALISTNSEREFPDEGFYDFHAQKLLEGSGFIQARPPVYPAFVAVVYLLFGRNYKAVQIAQGFLGLAAAFFVYFISVRLCERLRVNIAMMPTVAYGVAVLLPFTSFYERYQFTETLAVFLLLAAVLTWLKAEDDGRLAWYWLSGGLFGLLMLCRPIFMYLPIVFFVFRSLVVKERGGRLVRQLGTCFVGMTMVVTPWTIRNYILSETFIPLSVGGGFYLYLGTFYIDSNRFPPGFSQQDKERLGRYNSSEISLREQGEIDAVYKAKAIQRIKESPLEFLTLALGRLRLLWISTHSQAIGLDVSTRDMVQRLGSETNQGQSAWILTKILSKLALLCVNVVLLVLGLVGFWALLPHWKGSYAILLVPVYVSVLQMPIMTGARYSVPAWPFVAILVAFAVGLKIKAREPSQQDHLLVVR